MSGRQTSGIINLAPQGGSLQTPTFGASAPLDTTTAIIIITTIFCGVLKRNMRRRSYVTFGINQEIPPVKLIVFLTSMIGKVEKNKKIDSRKSGN